eukprot:gnl/Spiro4/14898_TR8029_c0_g1_i1.p1 gnl/Spiro4/14898_TR8029_c0_g1~~gnl/Spiro4/14898_TR8029_c0_g1_i1.p1  ORF type:complete len:1127 (-),score=361.05 gnl/Spiro4/14898_TR8029_c0_g1_i1:130-3333(-)
MELLTEAKVNFKKTKAISYALRELKSILENLPDAQIFFRDLPAYARRGLVLWGGKPAGDKPLLSFSRPESVSVVGSFMLHTVTQPDLNVDVAVEMPKAMFSHKDFLNYKYHDKRLVFLHHLAQCLSAHPLFRDGPEEEPVPGGRVQLAAFSPCDPHKLVLLLHPATAATAVGKATRFVIRVVPTVAASVFPPAKLAPARCNVRPRIGESAAGPETAAPATPFYSNTIVEDMHVAAHLTHMHSVLASARCACEAIVLLKVWLRRHFVGRDGPSGFLLTMLVCHLLSTHVLAPAMSVAQMLRLIFAFLANTDLTATSIVMASARPKNVDDFARLFDVVVLDVTGRVNLAARVSRSAAAELRWEAQRAQELLEADTAEAFAALFLTPLPVHAKFDMLLRLDGLPAAARDSAADEAVLCNGPWARVQLARLLQTLEQGLGDRCVCVRGCAPPCGPWALTARLPMLTMSASACTVGLLLHADRAPRVHDMGPPADDRDAARKFRDLWGPAAQVRRFPDGAIVESCVWSERAHPLLRSHLYVEQIVRHLLQLHHGCGALTVLGAQLDSILALAPDEHEYTRGVRSAQAKLESRLRGLRDMPLATAALLPISPVLRGTKGPPPPHAFARPSPALPCPVPSSRTVTPVEMLLQFEGSAAWPDDVDALVHLKAAFYLQIRDGLRKQFDVESIVTLGFIDIFLDGFVFRLAVVCERELKLLRSAGSPHAATAELTSVHLPLLTTALNALAGTHPAFGLTARLAKRWLDRHMFSAYIREEAVDLLVASLFVPSPHSPWRTAPMSQLCGFFRFLSLLAKFDWSDSGLIVDAEGALDSDTRASIVRGFDTQRRAWQQHSSESVAGMFIATSRDHTGLLWTANGPSPQVLGRIVAFARRSLEVVEGLMQFHHVDRAPSVTFESVFTTPLSEYDVLVHLHASLVPECARPKNKGVFAIDKKTKGESSQLLVGICPVDSFLAELRNHFAHLCLFFYDGQGGLVIGIVFLPPALQPRPFRPWDSCCMTVCEPDSSNSKSKKQKKQKKPLVNLDVALFLSDVQRIGQGLVKKCVVQRPHLFNNSC